MMANSKSNPNRLKPGLIETAAAIFNFAAVAAFVTTAFGFPAVMYRLQSGSVPLAFLSKADALTAGLIPAAFLGFLYLGVLAILRIMQADTPGRTVSTVITVIGALLGMFAFLIPLLILWIIGMLVVGATTPLLHILHLSYLVGRHAIPQSDVEAAFRQLSIWPFAILLLSDFALRVAMHHGFGRRWLESVRKWFSQERMTRHFTVCALLAVIVGLAVTVFTAVALSVIATVAIREFQMSTLSAMTSLLLSRTLGVIAFCTVLVFGPGLREGLRNLRPVGVAAYLLIVFWYSVRFYPGIPQWPGWRSTCRGDSVDEGRRSAGCTNPGQE